MYSTNYASWTSGIYPRHESLVQLSKSINIIHKINRLKQKKHRIISIEALDNPTSIPDKTKQNKTPLNKLEIGGNLLNLIKNICQKVTTNIIILNGK